MKHEPITFPQLFFDELIQPYLVTEAPLPAAVERAFYTDMPDSRYSMNTTAWD